MLITAWHDTHSICTNTQTPPPFPFSEWFHSSVCNAHCQPRLKHFNGKWCIIILFTCRKISANIYICFPEKTESLFKSLNFEKDRRKLNWLLAWGTPHISIQQVARICRAHTKWLHALIHMHIRANSQEILKKKNDEQKMAK